MYIIEVKNRAVAQKYLNQKTRFYPAVNLHRYQGDGRLFPSLRGGCFFGDDADIAGLKIAGIECAFVGPLKQTQVDEATKNLEYMDASITAYKRRCGALKKAITPDIDAIVRTINRYQDNEPSACSSGYYLVLHSLKVRAESLRKRPKITNDYLLQTMALDVGRIIGIWAPGIGKVA